MYVPYLLENSILNRNTHHKYAEKQIQEEEFLAALDENTRILEEE